MGYSSNIPKLYAIRLLFWMHFFSAVLVPFFTDWGGIKLSQVLFLNAWFWLWNFLLEVPTGTVADFLGRKISLAVGSLVGAAAAVLYTNQPGIVNFMIAEIVFATSMTLHSGADTALAYDSLKETGQEDRAKRVLSAMESFGLAGIIVGAIGGGFIAQAYGLRFPMLCYVIPSVLAFLVALTLKEPPVHQPGQRPNYGAILREGTRFFAGHRVLLIMAFDLAIINGLVWAIIWLFQPLLERAGMAMQWFGSVQALACVAQILLLSNVERVERWIGSKRRFLVAGPIAVGLCFLGLAYTRELALVVPLIIAAFAFGLTRVPLFNAYMNAYIPSDKRATVLSMVSMFRTFGIVVLNPITGVLADWSLSGTLAILGAGLLVLPLVSKVEESHLTGA